VQVNFGIKTLLLLVASFLFILAALANSGNTWRDLVAWGLGAVAAAFLLTDIGWDRKYGGRRG